MRETERVPCQRLSPSSYCVSLRCHIQYIVNAICSKQASLGLVLWGQDEFVQAAAVWRTSWAGTTALYGHGQPSNVCEMIFRSSAFNSYCCFQEQKRQRRSASAQQEQSSPSGHLSELLCAGSKCRREGEVRSAPLSLPEQHQYWCWGPEGTIPGLLD